MNKPKHCPFCKGKVYPVYASIDDRFRFYHYAESEKECAVEVIVLKRGQKSNAEAIEAWNRRCGND